MNALSLLRKNVKHITLSSKSYSYITFIEIVEFGFELKCRIYINGKMPFDNIKKNEKLRTYFFLDKKKVLKK